HTGGIFCALSETTAEVAREAMTVARAHGTVVSFDLNYRPSLWQAIGGPKRAAEVNQQLVGLVDVLLGNEEDFSAALGYEVEGADGALLELDPGAYERLLERVLADHAELRLVASTLRAARSATVNDWTAVCRTREGFHAGPRFDALEIYDRVGGGD